MNISDVTLAEISDLSYFDIPKSLKNDIDKYEKNNKLDAITLSELCAEILKENFGQNYNKAEYNEKEQRNITILEKYSKEEYSKVKVVGYENNNANNINNPNSTKSGAVSYAFETNPGEVTIVSRGSEFEGVKYAEDWIDNLKIPLTETKQQKETLAFIEKMALKYEKIRLTGHSKGGNNIMYALIVADPKIREKVIQCSTFNAPGFWLDFFKEHGDSIKDVKKSGILTEYRHENDYVSSLMMNLGIVKFIEGKNPASFEDHFIYQMLMDGDNFKVLDSPKIKPYRLISGLIANGLLMGMEFLKFDRQTLGIFFPFKKYMPNLFTLIKKAKKVKKFITMIKVIIAKSIGDFICNLRESIEEKSGIIGAAFGGILVSLASFFNTVPLFISLKKTIGALRETIEGSAKAVVGEINLVEKKEIKPIPGDFITPVNINNIKEVNVNSIDQINPIIGEQVAIGKLDIEVGDKNAGIEKIGKSDVDLQLGMGKLEINPMKINSRPMNFIDVDFNRIEDGYRIYKKELNKLQEIINRFKKTLQQLMYNGWSGKARDTFKDIIYLTYIDELEEFKLNLKRTMKMLDMARKLYKERYKEEKQLAMLLA